MTYPAVIFWLLFFRGALSSQRTLLLLLFSSLTFGSLAVLPPELTAGSSFVPKTMFALLIVLKVLVPAIAAFSPRAIELARFQNMGFLLAFLVIGLLTTVFMPRLFAGVIEVVPLKVLGFSRSEPLQPSQGNITQSIYLSVSVAVAGATALMARSPRFPEQILTAVLVGGIVLLASGIIDMVVSAAGQAALLDPFRNAGYALLTNAEVLGVRRVVGLMPEASSYGSTCVALGSALAFLRPLYAAGFYRRLASVATIMLFGMALLSTSSSAYAGVAFFSITYVANVGQRLAGLSTIGCNGLVAEFCIAIIGMVIILLILLLSPEAFDPVQRFLDEIIFNKATSDSFAERSFWNEVGWNAFLSSYGLGVGLGSARASNYFIAVISNTGFIGSSCFLIFLIQTLLRRTFQSRQASALASALKFTMVPSLCMAALGSATPDFEPWLGIIFGAITGLAMRKDEKAFVARHVEVSQVQNRAFG